MTKAVAVMKTLAEKRKLRKLCFAFSVSYKFCHAVASEKKKPTWRIIDKFRPIVPVNFWFEESDEAFAASLVEAK